MTFLEHITRRGMLQDHTPGLDRLLESSVRGYMGFDPTAPSLHIGNLVSLTLLEQFQRAGHRPVILLGGATGMIGDPSFKKQERRFIEEDKLRYHETCLRCQFEQLIDFSGSCGAMLVNNYDWYKEMNLLYFLRQAGKLISVNYMMGKESVKNRLVDGISYTEFSYQILQAYDFYHLHQAYGVKLQLGGADQWGNITTGIELVRKKTGERVHGATTPLLVKADGNKFGKTEQGNIWLDPALTSPYAFYQYFLNCSDEEVPMLLRRMTFFSLDDIIDWEQSHKKAPHKRLLQHKLAKYLTTRVHSLEAYKKVSQASEVLFGQSPVSALKTLDEKTLADIFAQLPHVKITADACAVKTLVDLLTVSSNHVIFSSKRAAREMIAAGGVRVNKERFTDPSGMPKLDWIQGRYILIQKGKKHYFLLEKCGK